MSSSTLASRILQAGDAECVQVPQMITCALDHVLFEMHIDARPYALYGHPEGSLYMVDGEDIDYSDDTEGFLTMSEEKILKPIAEIAADRLAS